MISRDGNVSPYIRRNAIGRPFIRLVTPTDGANCIHSVRNDSINVDLGLDYTVGHEVTSMYVLGD